LNYPDPFASSAPEPEEFALDTVITDETPIPESKPTKKSTTKKDTPNLSMTEAPFSMTTKLDGQLLTVRGRTVEEFNANAAELAANLSGVKALNAAVGVAGGAAPRAAAAAPAKKNYQARQAQAAKPAGAVPRTSAECAHGELVYSEWGENRYGKPYQAFKCPVPYKDPECCGNDATLWFNEAKKQGLVI